MSYLLLQGDAVHLPFSDRSIDLCFGSPPYIDARTYGIAAQRACQEWIDWMLVVTTEACRVSKGLVLWVCASGVRNHCYQPAPEGLLYEWWRRGGQCWRPAYWYRSGIPGSGGRHWLRADVEYVLAFLGPDRRPQRKTPNVSRKELGERRKKAVKDGIGSRMLCRDGSYWVDTDDKYLWNYVPPEKVNPGNLIETDEDEGVWTDNTAMGKPPKWAPGGEKSNLQSDGTRVTQWGSRVRHKGGTRDANGNLCPNGRPSHYEVTDSKCIPVLVNPGNLIELEDEGVWTDNTAMGHKPVHHEKSGHTKMTKFGYMENQTYNSPVLSNPGNLIKMGSGFGSMGSPHAHDNEAPFPEALAEFFIKTACKPDGIVLDPFSGSGTTVAVAERLGRIGIGLDIRRSQAELAERRITRPHSERKRTGREEKDLPLFR